MLRRHPRPFAARGLLAGGEFSRLATMVVMLAVLWMLISRARDPDTWKWLAPADESSVAASASSSSPLPTPHSPLLLIPGPTGDDPEEMQAALEEFQAITDRQEYDVPDMASYWRMMRWTLAESFESLEGKSRDDLFYTQFWENPALYRGELTQLRLHIKQVIRHKAPKNSAGLREVYEVRGYTDESKSNVYVCILPELPPEIEVGPIVYDEGLFVGYFHKLFRYQAFDKTRAAPAFIGRMRRLPNMSDKLSVSKDGKFWPAIAIGGGLLATLLVGRRLLGRSEVRRAPQQAARESEAIESWLNSGEPGPDDVRESVSPDPSP